MLPQIACSGSPYEIGYTHGIQAKELIHGSIAFYSALFLESTQLDWHRVQAVALTFEPTIKSKWPDYLEEMQGIAAGASVPVSSILALNVRTEITFGLASPSSANNLTSPLPNLTTSEIPSDGCTALSHLTRTSSFLAQNWDWLEAQQANLILLCISARDKPTIKMMTEAGIIGKIGLNSSGVGVCLNAIRAVGMDATRMPVHLALRAVLESRSMGVAVQSLESCGVASACHMLLGDAQGSVGLEWSCRDLVKVEMDARGEVVHSNHYLLPHVVPEANGWVDSPFRFERMTALARGLGDEATRENVRRLFEDEKNSPAGICRKQEGASTAATLFNIVMDLKAGTAVVKMGRPTEDGEEIEITF